MDEQKKNAFSFAQDCTKQIITLATGVIALEITFAKDFVSTLAAGSRVYALLSWLSFLLSVIFGIWTLLALTGELERIDGESKTPSIRAGNVTFPAIAQIIFFIIGLGLTAIFGAVAIWRMPIQPK